MRLERLERLSFSHDHGDTAQRATRSAEKERLLFEIAAKVRALASAIEQVSQPPLDAAKDRKLIADQTASIIGGLLREQCGVPRRQAPVWRAQPRIPRRCGGHPRFGTAGEVQKSPVDRVSRHNRDEERLEVVAESQPKPSASQHAVQSRLIMMPAACLVLSVIGHGFRPDLAPGVRSKGHDARVEIVTGA